MEEEEEDPLGALGVQLDQPGESLKLELKSGEDLSRHDQDRQAGDDRAPQDRLGEDDQTRFNNGSDRLAENRRSNDDRLREGLGHCQENIGVEEQSRHSFNGREETEFDTGERDLQELIEKTKEQSKLEERLKLEDGLENGEPSLERGIENSATRPQNGGDEFSPKVPKDEAPKTEVDADTNRQYSDHTDLLCLVECSICGSSMLHHSFRKHISTHHKVNLRNYNDAYGEVVFTRKVFHKCKLQDCQEDVLLSYESISHHLRTAHQLTLHTYANKFNVFHEGVDGDGRVGLIHEFDYNSWLREFVEFGEDGEKYFSDNLDEGCIYRCKVCTEDVLHFLFSEHLRAEHGLDLESYLGEYKEHEYARLTHYKCRVCQADVLLAADAICSHVVDQHGLSMEDYIAGYDAFEAGCMTTSITGLVSRQEILRLEAGQAQDPDLEEERIYTDNLEYSCLYRCGACRRQVSNLTLERHLSKKHHMDLAKYNQVYGAIEFTRLVFYRCKVCDAALVFSFDDIDRHVKESHSLTLEDYEINYNAFECTDKQGEKQELVTSSDYHLPLQDRVYSDSLDDMCLYKCCHCGKIFYHSLLLKHVARVHNVKQEFDTFTQYQDKLKVERMCYYKCKLCPAELIFTIASINHHITNVHHLSLQDYVSNYRGFDTNDKKYNSQTRDNSAPKRPLIIDLDDNILRKRSRRCADGEKFISDNPDDMCVCRCNFCGLHVLHHLLRKHVLSKHTEDKDNYGEYDYVFKSYYRCKVCDSEILFSLEAIKNHVKKSHKMTLTQYKDGYRAFTQDPEIVFPEDGVEEEEGAVEPAKQEEQEEENESLIPADPDFFEKMELERELANLR